MGKASTAAHSAVEAARRQEAEITATDAQVKALQFDYLGAAAAYAEAASELPASATTAKKWAYAVDQAGQLEKRGELFDEPRPLHDAVALYRGALQLVSREADAVDWAHTRISLGSRSNCLATAATTARCRNSIAAEQAALEVLTPTAQPLEWAKA